MHRIGIKPATSDYIYLDNCATTPVHESVVATMMPFLFNQFGNASSQHALGRQARSAIERAREQVASLINAAPSEIYFTPNATYSNNAALLGRAAYVEKHNLGRHIITSKIEHASALEPVKQLKNRGWKVTVLPVDHNGLVDLSVLQNAITSDTSIISIMWANNEVGSVQPIAEIAAIAKESGIFFHTDAVQAAGKISIDVAVTEVDSLSLSGHKFHAPKGIGIHYVKSGVKILPFTFGGGQENGFAPGTENVAFIAGIGQAAAIARENLKENSERLSALGNIIRVRLLQLAEVRLTGTVASDARVPGLISLTVDGWSGKELVEAADRSGICIASSSACSSGSTGSRILRAMGFSEEQSAAAIRISVGTNNTEAECIEAAEVLCRLIQERACRLIA